MYRSYYYIEKHNLFYFKIINKINKLTCEELRSSSLQRQHLQAKYKLLKAIALQLDKYQWSIQLKLASLC